jgi:hypothetical protein
MADRARTQGRPNAAHEVARDLLDLAGIGLGGRTPMNGVHHTNGASRSREAN